VLWKIGSVGGEKSYEPQNQLAKQKLSEKEQETGQRGNLLTMRLHGRVYD